MTFLRNAWYVAMWSQDLVDQPKPQRFLDEPLVFFRSSQGDIHALADACPHRYAPLHLGKILGDRLRCQYHGLEFDGAGVCVRNPHLPSTSASPCFWRSTPGRCDSTASWTN